MATTISPSFTRFTDLPLELQLAILQMAKDSSNNEISTVCRDAYLFANHDACIGWRPSTEWIWQRMNMLAGRR